MSFYRFVIIQLDGMLTEANRRIEGNDNFNRVEDSSLCCHSFFASFLLAPIPLTGYSFIVNLFHFLYLRYLLFVYCWYYLHFFLFY